MLKIRITHLEGQKKEAVHEVAGHEATIGRAPDSDIVVPDGHVSARHAKVLSGVVVVDLESTNGTFVDGSRAHPATLLRDGKFMLGSEIAVEVLDDDPLDDQFAIEQTLIASPTSASATAFQRAKAMNEAAAGGDAQRTTSVPAGQPAGTGAPTGDADADGDAAELRRENEDLRRRIDSLKRDVESRETSDADSPQARLAHEALERVREQNETLQKRVLELEKEKGRADVEAAKGVLEQRVAQLESDRADLTAERERLRSELAESEKAREDAAQKPASDIFFKLQQEIQRLKKELETAPAARSTQAAAVGGGESGELFFELREENERLRAELEEARVATPAAPASATDAETRITALEDELHAERMSKADMLAELESLRRKAETAPTPMPAVKPGDARGVLEILHRAADEDVTHVPVDMGLPTAEFLSLELFRFVRHAEKIITRLAGAFIQLYNPQTVLPDADKTLRELTLELIDTGDDPGLRGDLTEYLDKLKKWLAVAVQAYPRAAEAYALKLRDDLSEASLTKDDPIPRFKRLSGHAEGELWSRASKVLDGMSDETVRDGVERLARVHAGEMFDTLDDDTLA